MQPAKQPSREHALAARAAKRAHAESLGLDERFVSCMVERFYTAVRADEMLAPIFNAKISEWPEHLDRMKSFWRSVLFNSGEFSGNPMLKHMVIAGLGKDHFIRWLELFYATLQDLEAEPEGVALVASKARSIADSLLTGITMRRSGLDGANAGKDLPHV